MPQLEIATYITQIFWLLVTFIGFWVIMDKVFVPKIAEKIEARKRKYDDFILTAEETKKKALEALNRYEKTLAEAKSDASRQIEQNEQELKKVIAEKEEEMNSQLKQKIAENAAKISQEKSNIMEKIDELSQTMAFTIIKQLGISSISQEDIKEIKNGESK